MIEVYPSGLEVTLAGDITGTILAVMIENKNMSYKVAWWNGRSREEQWAHSCEIVPKENLTVQVGFR